MSLPFAKTNVSVSFVKTKMLGNCTLYVNSTYATQSAFDLIELDGNDLRREPLKAELALGTAQGRAQGSV